MARNCGWCTAHNRDEWERRLLRGESIRDVANDTPFSLAAAYRHLRAHVAPTLVEQMRTPSSGVGMGDLISRLLELSDDAAEVRHQARERSDGRLLLQAVAVERDGLLALADRLGIDSSEVVDQIEEARALVDALAPLLPQYPAFARDLAVRLRAAQQDQLAEGVEKASGQSAQMAVTTSPALEAPQ